MLLVLVLAYILRGAINTGAIPLSEATTLPGHTVIGSALPQGCVCPDNRTRLDILWSCLATIFACSWVSVHPNIALGEGWLKKSLRRLELMFWSVIAPEIFVGWAAEQWVIARHLAKDYAEDGWTMTHGHFIQMGGFLIYDDKDEAVDILQPDNIDYLLRNKVITLPTISEEDIKDRSKGDGLSKALVVVQTTWFITQCIARRVQGLLITELELATLAFASLNGVICLLWWHKPLDVQSTVPVYINSPTSESASPIDGEAIHNEVLDIAGSSNVGQNDGNPQGLDPHQNPTLPGSGEGEPIHDEDINSEHGRSEVTQNGSTSEGNFTKLFRQAWRILSGIIYRWALYAIKRVHIHLAETVERHTFPGLTYRVGNVDVYAPAQVATPRERFFTVLLPPAVAILFGAIHCAGWNFFFPSIVERNIWRVSSIVIVGLPVNWLVANFFMRGYFTDPESFQMPTYLVKARVLVLLPVLFYSLARLALLLEALILLRDLPPGALEVVKWTSFIPHI